MTASEVVYRVIRWLSFPGPIKKGLPPAAEAPAVFLTGPGLIGRIVRAVELNPSVILSGPRGCGKSYCVDRAIAESSDRGLFPKGARRFLQGNREIPRDYMVEDEIAFRTTRQNDGSDQVAPYRRPSPLFAFAKRDPKTGVPCVDRETGVVPCIMTDEDGNELTGHDGKPIPCKKYVLFLDEINRFSDGVLDALLSVLEERKAVLAGAEYGLPVVVLMTMNPPGYDGSARKLSPPLAARIGRTYRLCSPDLDTLSDQIIQSKLDALRKRYAEGEAEKPQDKRGPEFPAVEVETIRKVGLLTLLCWGDISETKPGTEYLTPATQSLLLKVMAEDHVAAAAMKDLAELCQFGPDGRAGSDWLTNAIGVALIDAERQGLKEARLRDDHLLRTVVESVSHKIYDSFSQAARPDLLARKERAVATLCRQVLHRPLYNRLVARLVDKRASAPDRKSPAPLESSFATALPEVGFEKLSELFRRAGVTDDAAVGRWMKVASRVSGAVTADELFKELTNEGFLVPEDSNAGPALSAGFRTWADDNLARAVAWEYGPGGKPPLLLGQLFHTLLEERPIKIGAQRRPLDEELADSPVVRAIGVPQFVELCRSHRLEEAHRSPILVVARQLDALWAIRVQRGREPEAVDKAAEDLKEVTLDGRQAAVPFQFLLDLLDPLLTAVATDREHEAAGYVQFLELLRGKLQTMRKEAEMARIGATGS
jgi:hypothetical protein